MKLKHSESAVQRGLDGTEALAGGQTIASRDLWRRTGQNSAWQITGKREGASTAFPPDTGFADNNSENAENMKHKKQWRDGFGVLATTFLPGSSYADRPVSGVTFHDLTQVNYPDGTSESFSYGVNGNVLTHTDRAGKVFTFANECADGFQLRPRGAAHRHDARERGERRLYLGRGGQAHSNPRREHH